MESGLLHLHNLLRWIVLLFALLTLIKSFSGMNGTKEMTGKDTRLALFLLISVDIQLLLGLALYIQRGWFKVLSGGGEVMKNPALRFWSVEHISGMLIAIILIHIGYSATKKNIPDNQKFKRLFWFTLIGLLLMLVTIPWPFREVVGRPWLPGLN
jgi:heme A synthase